MVTASASAPDPASIRSRTWVLVALVALGAAATYVAVRSGVPRDLPGFQGVCQRLVQAGITLGPQDRMCGRDPSGGRTLFLLASAAVGVGLAWPPVVLAATGRRLTAFLPLVPVAGGVTVSASSLSLWNGPPRISEGILAAALDLTLLAAPSVAVAYVLRRRARPRGPELGWLGCLISASVCAAVVAAILAVVPLLQRWHYGSLGGDPSGTTLLTLLPAALVMGIFGALLGFDRRWWPWSFAPAALFLSLGPSVAFVSTTGYPGVAVWAPFGVVIPLFLVGLATTWWRPMSVAISAWLERSDASDFDELPEPEVGASSPIPDRRRALRPTVIPQAIAAGLLAVSVVIFVGDPSPVAFAEVLPTYGGLRAATQDLRVRMNLRQAMTAMTTYRAEHGTVRGFDGVAGAKADASLVWLPPPANERQMQAFQASAIAVVPSRLHAPRLIAVSESGRAFCLQRSTDGRLTFGTGDRTRKGSFPAAGAWREAMATCGDHAWTSTTLSSPPIDGMCDGLDVGYLLCRSVQALIAEQLQEPVDGAP